MELDNTVQYCLRVHQKNSEGQRVSCCGDVHNPLCPKHDTDLMH